MGVPLRTRARLLCPDGDDLAAEVNASGARIRAYAYWPGIDQPHSMRTWESGQNGATYYYALDLPSNNVQGLFGTAGSVAARYDYSPFGRITKQGGPLVFGTWAAKKLGDSGFLRDAWRWYTGAAQPGLLNAGKRVWASRIGGRTVHGVGSARFRTAQKSAATYSSFETGIGIGSVGNRVVVLYLLEK